MSDEPREPFLLVGLGNPGRAYHRNRHNIGFMVVDALAAAMGVRFSRHQSQALLCDGRLHGRRTYLAKPQTFMNLAGPSVGSLARYYKVPRGSVLVIFDDLDLPLGNLRLRASGGSGGHRGMASILAALGGEDVPRMRLGIGRPPGRMDPADFVLEDFHPHEAEAVEASLRQAADCVGEFVQSGIDLAMTRCNTPPS
jgi:PTH1 family peptidyl-tRNA hydrolase